MTRRHLAAATLVAALALSGLPGLAGAQDAEPADEAASDKTVSGELSVVDGLWYVTPDGGEPIALRFGPSWFNDLYALFGLSAGEDVTIGGNVRGGEPNENAADAAKDPVVRILTVDDQKRTKGKPPWAGGPKELGDAHPGFEGWSKGQAKKAQNATKVPPGQARKADPDAWVPPGQARKAED